MKRAFKISALITAVFVIMSALASCVECKKPDEDTGTPNFPLIPELSRRPDFISTENPGKNPETETKSGDYRRSTLYYLTDEGYILPVTVDIPQETGIARACLARLVSNPANRIETQKKGLKTLIPEGAVIEINIAGGLATVNLKNITKITTAEEEKAMFTGIVNTLTEFKNIDAVSVLINGKSGKTSNGIEMPVKHGKYALNAENADVAASGNAKPLQLFFPNEAGSHIIPVTRYTNGPADLYSAISGLVEGTSLLGLRSCFPKNTLALAATVENGTLLINLTSDFEKIAEIPGVFELAKQTALMTARQYSKINDVIFLVNGAPYSPETK